MRVLIINSVCGEGSTGRICLDIAKQMSTEGYQVKIAYGRGSLLKTSAGFGIRIGNNWGVKLHGLLTRAFDRTGFYSKHATKKFLRWAEEYKPDLIWLHNLHGYYINVKMLFEWIKRHPNMQVKWTLHDCWAFTGHCPHFEFVECNKWQNQCYKCKQKREYPASYLFDNSKKNFIEKKAIFTGVKNLTIITPSLWLQELVKKSFLKDYNKEVIYNSVDKKIFYPQQSNFREKYNLENKKIILGVANIWDQRKGINDFIELYKRINDETVIVLVGVDEKQKKSLPKEIISIERTNSAKELAQIYSSANVFFNPTYADTLPTVNLEAEACGTPVITYRTGGAPETIKRQDSKVVEKGNYLAVLEFLRKV